MTHNRHKITSVTTWIAGMVAVAVTLLLPLGYFAVSYQYLSGSLRTEAEITSHLVTEVINANPELWQYEQIRLEELLARRMRNSNGETRCILDLRQRLVAENGRILNPPSIASGFNLMDAGTAVGRLEIRTSLRPLLLRSALVALVGLFCGVMIFVTLRVLPLRAVALAEKSLRKSEAELTDKVALLEAALVKVKQLEGIIPICMYCKKIRDDKESWQQMEGYISQHSEAQFSHGICPECYTKVSGDYLKELENMEDELHSKR
jgi:hypothetical protein